MTDLPDTGSHCAGIRTWNRSCGKFYYDKKTLEGVRNLFYNKGGYSHSAREYEKRYGGCWRNPAAFLYKKECVLGVDTFRQMIVYE